MSSAQQKVPCALPIDPNGPPICAEADLKVMALQPLGQINLRGTPALLKPILKSALGLSYPERPNTVSRTASDQYRCLWLGPDESLVVGPLGDSALQKLLKASKPEGHIGITDVSHNRVGFRIIGGRAETLLSKGCGLDFMSVKDCAQTRIGRVNVILIRVDDGFEILVGRSFAAYLDEWLHAAV